MNIAELRDQHDSIMAVANELRIAVGDVSTPKPVSAIRWRLARLLLAHLAIEDGHFYPSMLCHSDRAAQEKADRFQKEMGKLSSAFSQYMAAWTDVQIGKNWPKFCTTTQDILAALERRVAQENAQLYPLAPPGWNIYSAAPPLLCPAI